MAHQFNPIDLKSRVAFYIQVIDAFKSKLNNGELQPGDQLPSEAELCGMFQVSRTVIRQALMEMEHAGLIVKRKGRESRIADHKVNIALTNFEPGDDQGDKTHQGKIENLTISKTIVSATSQVAKAMRVVKEGDKVVQIERVHLVDDRPALFRVSYLPYPLGAPVIEADTTKSLFHAIRVLCGVILDHGYSRFEAISAPERQARLLNLEPGVPMLKVSSVNFTKDEDVAEYSIYYMPGETSQVTASFFHFPQFNATIMADDGRRVSMESQSAHRPE